MKKIILILFIFLALGAEGYSQGYTVSVDTTTLKLSAFLNKAFHFTGSDSISTMSGGVQYATWTFQSTADTLFKFSTHSDMSNPWYSKAGESLMPDFDSRAGSNVWFRPINSGSTATQITVKFLNLIK